MAPKVAALQCMAAEVVSDTNSNISQLDPREGTTDDGNLETMRPQQFHQEQGRDPVLARIQHWLDAGQWPTWAAVSALDPETKALYSQWAILCYQNGLLYRQWQSPAEQHNILHLLATLPNSSQGSPAGSVGAAHYGVTKTLQPLRSSFYWPGCQQDVELHVHC